MRTVRIFMMFVVFIMVTGVIRIWNMDPYGASIPVLVISAVVGCLFWFAIAMLVYWIWRKKKGLDLPENQWNGPDHGLTDRPIPDSWVPVNPPGGMDYSENGRAGWRVDRWMDWVGVTTYYPPKWYCMKDESADFTQAVAEFADWMWNHLAVMEMEGRPYENRMGNVMLLIPEKEQEEDRWYTAEMRMRYDVIGLHIVRIGENGEVYDSFRDQQLLSVARPKTPQILQAAIIFTIIMLIAVGVLFIHDSWGSIDDMILAVQGIVLVAGSIILLRRYNITKQIENAQARKGTRPQRIQKILDYRKMMDQSNALWFFENREGRMPRLWERTSAPYNRRYSGFDRTQDDYSTQMPQYWLRLKEGYSFHDGALTEVADWISACRKFDEQWPELLTPWRKCTTLLLANQPGRGPLPDEKELLLKLNIHLVKIFPEYTLFDQCDDTLHFALFDFLERPPAADPDFRRMPGDPAREEDYWWGDGKLPEQFVSCANPFLDDELENQSEISDQSFVNIWLEMREPLSQLGLNEAAADILEWKKRRIRYHQQQFGIDTRTEPVVVIPIEYNMVQGLPESLITELKDHSIMYGVVYGGDYEGEEFYLVDLLTGKSYYPEWVNEYNEDGDPCEILILLNENEMWEKYHR